MSFGNEKNCLRCDTEDRVRLFPVNRWCLAESFCRREPNFIWKLSSRSSSWTAVLTLPQTTCGGAHR